MQNLKILLKYNFLKIINIFRGKKREKSISSAIFALIFACLGIFALYTFQAFSMFEGLAKLGLAKVCLFHGLMVAFLVLFIFAIMRIAGAKKSSDEDFLMSLPMSKTDIVLSKTLGKYLVDFAFAFVLVVPFLVLYLIYTSFNFWVLLSGVMLVFLFPLFSIGLTNIFGFLVSRVFSRSRFSGMLKSLVATILMIFALTLIMLKTFGYGNVNPLGLTEYFSDRPIISQLLYFVLNDGFLPKMLVLALTIIPFVLGLWLYAKNIGRDPVGFKSSRKKLRFDASKSSFLRFFKKEASAYFSSPAYVSNTIIGPILMIIFAVVIASLGGGVLGFFGENQILLVAVLILGLCMFCALTPISAASLSLEGESFWVLKTMPIKHEIVLSTKAIFNFLMLAVPVFLASIILSFAFAISFINFLYLLLIPMIFSLVISFGGVLLNLLYPKMKWETETQVIKQSLAVVLTMFGGMLLPLLPTAVYLIFPQIDIQFILSATVVIFAILLVAVVLTLKSKGQKLFEKIE